MNAETDQIPLLSQGQVHSYLNRLTGFESGVVLQSGSIHEYWPGSTSGITCINPSVGSATPSSVCLGEFDLGADHARVWEFLRKPMIKPAPLNKCLCEFLPFVVGCIVYAHKEEANGETTRPIPAVQLIGKRAIESPLHALQLAEEAHPQKGPAIHEENEGIIWDERRLKVLAAARAFGEETDANY